MLAYQKLLESKARRKAKEEAAEKQKPQSEEQKAIIVNKTKTIAERAPAYLANTSQRVKTDTEKKNIIVDKMITLEELFRFSMDDTSPLYSFLKSYPEHERTMSTLSYVIKEALRKDLGGSEGKQKMPESEIFKQAFLDLLPTNGNSMLVYLKKNETLYQSLTQYIDTLFPVYEAFCKYKSKDIINPEPQDLISIQEAEELMGQLSLSTRLMKSKL